MRLRFTSEGACLYVVVTSASPGWASAAVRMGRCLVEFSDGEPIDCAVTRVTDERERREALDSLRRKYTADLWERHFARKSAVLRLEPGASAAPRSGRERVREEFDDVAPQYEARLGAQPLERALKQRVLAMLVSELATADPLLEIGPGVGLETIPLLAAGHRITAVDLSPRMLDELRTRATRAQLVDRLTPRLGALGEIATVLGDVLEGGFGGAYSTFGAFNLEDDLRGVGAALARLVRPGGRLVFTTLNRPSPTAFAWELALGRWDAAGARLRAYVPGGRLRYPLDVWLRRPKEWDAVLGTSFRRLRTRAVSVVAPPFEPGRPRAFLSGRAGHRLASLDAWLSRRPSLAEVGEWTVLVYGRVAA